MRLRYFKTAGVLVLLCTGLALLPGLSWAGFGGSGFPVLQVQGPSTLKASQAFHLSFSYPPTLAHSAAPYIYWDMEVYFCQNGIDQHPENLPGDIGQESFPTPQNSAICSTVGPSSASPFYRKPLVGPGSGHFSFDMTPYLSGIHQTWTHQSSTASLHTWLKGSTVYVRVRLASQSAGEGPWGAWHRTSISSGISYHVVQPGAHTFHGTAQPNYALMMQHMKAPIVITPKAGSMQRGTTIPLSLQLPVHNDYSKWLCCDLQFERTVITTKENIEYVNSHHSFPRATEPRKPWHYAYGYASTSEHGMIGPGSTWSQTPSAGPFQPHSPEFGYRYWMRVREEFLPHGFGHSSHEVPGPWSAWRSFDVEDPIHVMIPNHGTLQVNPHQNGQKSGQTGQSNNSRLPAVQERHMMLHPLHN